MNKLYVVTYILIPDFSKIRLTFMYNNARTFFLGI